MIFLEINIILLWLLIIIFAYKIFGSRISIEIEKTFWEHKPYGISITKWDKPKGEMPNHGVSIFYFEWRNPEKIKDNMDNAKQ